MPLPKWPLHPLLVLPSGVQRGVSLHTTVASSREVLHLPPPFRLGQGGLNTSLIKGLTAQAAGYHQTGPNLTEVVLLPQQTHGDHRVLLLCLRILPGPDIKDPRQAQVQHLL